MEEEGAEVKGEEDGGGAESPARKKRRSAGASPTPEGAPPAAAPAAEAAVAAVKGDAAGLWEQLEVKKEEEGSDEMETNSQGAPLLLPLLPPLLASVRLGNSLLLALPAAFRSSRGSRAPQPTHPPAPPCH